jgi:hypothetical protein
MIPLSFFGMLLITMMENGEDIPSGNRGIGFVPFDITGYKSIT